MHTKKVGQISGLFSPILEKWRLKKVTKYINGTNILDLGCGSGKILEYLPTSISKYTGVDSDEHVIENAKKIKMSFKTEFFIIQLGKNNLDFKDKYDTIIMSAFLEHLEDPSCFLCEVKQFLATDGIIIITTPSSKSENILKIGSWFKLFSREAFNEHKNHFSEKSLIHLANRAGLNIINFEKFEFGLNQLTVLKNKKNSGL